MPISVTCYVCGLNFKVKPSYLNRLKNPDKICCSTKCSATKRSELMVGEGNHQYGLKGPLNPSFKSGSRITNYGYRVIYKPEHPSSSKDGYVKEHRYIAETLLELNDTNSNTINGVRVLKEGYDVHHIDGDKLNNSPENLMVLTISEHTRLHNLDKPMERCNDTGKFISRG